MLSPIQRWLADPNISRWEQPSYESLKSLSPTSALIRKRQAYVLWQTIFTVHKEISALTWAKLYAAQARSLVEAHPLVFKLIPQLSLNDRWLHYASCQPSFTPSNNERHVAGEKSLSLLRTLGHEHVLSQAFVEVFWPTNEQITFWRHAFPRDPMNEHMQTALSVQAVRRQTLDGYLRARKHFKNHEYYDNVDLSILADD